MVNIKKVSTIFKRMCKRSGNEAYQAVYCYADNLYCTDGYRVFMVKGSEVDYNFPAVKHGDDVLNLLRPYLDNCNEAFKLPTTAAVKQYIKDHNYKRSQVWDAKYQLENKVYVNAFYLLDALEIIPEAKGYWSGQMIRLGRYKEKYRCRGGIHITDGGKLVLAVTVGRIC